MFQDPRSQFFTTNTTDEIVLGMENIPLERPVMQQRVKAVCSQMNIERLLDRRIFPLSSGEKQLIAIASVCAMEPKAIVMDEPSANLDSDAMVRLGFPAVPLERGRAYHPALRAPLSLCLRLL